MMANIVMLGFLAAVQDVVSADALRDAVADSVPPATKENNIRAFDRGREYGEAILKGRAKQERCRRTSMKRAVFSHAPRRRPSCLSARVTAP